MINTAYQAWRSDRAEGLDSLLIAADNATVQALNLRAQADRIAEGTVQPPAIPLHDGTTAGIGDTIITRRVDRTIPDGLGSTQSDQNGRLTDGYLRNGTILTVTKTNPDGSLCARPAAGTRVTLPPGYVAQHVDLGYAVTAHRAQGATVATTHTVTSITMTVEAFYVALTRGTTANHAYIVNDQHNPNHDHLAFGVDPQARDEILRGILARTGAETSAHEQIDHSPRSRMPRTSKTLQTNPESIRRVRPASPPSMNLRPNTTSPRP